MQLKVKLTNSLQNLSVPENLSELTVRQLKGLIASSFNESEEGMRLVVRGRVLQDDDTDLSQYNIQDLDTVYVARTKSSTSPTKTSLPREGAGDPMGDLMKNPMVESLMSNPSFMRSIMQSNPQIQRMIEEMPELREAMNDPSFFTELTRASTNPSIRQEMMRNQDRTLQNIESMPGGMQHLSSMFKNLDKTNSFRPADSTEEGDKLLAAQLLGSNTSSYIAGPNTEALPNPWAPRRSPQIPEVPMLPSPSSSQRLSPFAAPYMEMLQQRGNFSNPPDSFLQQFTMLQPSSSGQRRQIVIEEPAEIRYKVQLDTLKDMGFTNEIQNRRAIVHSSGNLDAAVEIILAETPEAFL